jgi:hypothetical protein
MQNLFVTATSCGERFFEKEKPTSLIKPAEILTNAQEAISKPFRAVLDAVR